MDVKIYSGIILYTRSISAISIHVSNNIKLMSLKLFLTYTDIDFAWHLNSVDVVGNIRAFIITGTHPGCELSIDGDASHDGIWLLDIDVEGRSLVSKIKLHFVLDIRKGIICLELDAYIHLSVVVCNVIEEIFERNLEGNYFVGSTLFGPL